MARIIEFPTRSDDFAHIADYCDQCGDTESAIIYLTEALRTEQDVYRRARLYSLLARQYLSADRVELSNRALFLALAIEPRNAEYNAKMMINMLATGDAQGAEYYFGRCDQRKIVQAFPDILEQMQEHDFDAEAVGATLNDFLRDAMREQALPDWNVRTRKGRLKRSLAQCYLMMTAGLFELAIAALLQLREKTAGKYAFFQTELHNALACCYLNTQQYDLAKEELDAVAATGSVGVDTLCLQYTYARKVSDYETEERCLDAMFAYETEDFAEVYKIAHALHTGERYDDVVRLMTRRIRERPYIYELYRLKGIAQFNCGKKEAARRTFVDMQRLYADFTDAPCFVEWINDAEHPDGEILQPSPVHELDSPITAYYRARLVRWLQGDPYAPEDLFRAIGWLCEVPYYLTEVFTSIDRLAQMDDKKTLWNFTELLCIRPRIQAPVAGHILFCLMMHGRCGRIACVSDERIREIALRVPSELTKCSDAARQGYCLLYALLAPEDEERRKQLYTRVRMYAKRMREESVQVRSATAFAWALCKTVFGENLEHMVPYLKIQIRTAKRYAQRLEELEREGESRQVSEKKG